jgi:PAS domain S-box-containing protein
MSRLFAPIDVRNEATTFETIARRRRGLFIFGASIISLTGLLLYAGIVLFINHEYITLSFIGSLALVYSILIYLVRKDKIEIAAAILTVIAAVGFLQMALVDDPEGDSGLFFFSAYPILALFLSGKKRGMIHVGLLIALLLGLYAANLTGVYTLPYQYSAYRDFAASFLVITGLVYLYQDLIETSQNLLKNRDELLAHERDQAKAVVTSIGEGVFVFNGKQQITAANPIAAQLLGLGETQLVGQPLSSLLRLSHRGNPIHPDRSPIQHLLSTGQIIITNLEDDIYCQTFNGGLLPITFVASPLRDRRGVSGGVIVFRDISKDKQAAQYIEHEVKERTRQVREGQTKLVASINSLPLGYIMTNQKLEVTVANQTATMILGKAGLISDPRMPINLLDVDSKLGDAVSLSARLQRALMQSGNQRLTDVQCNGLHLQFFISPIVHEHLVIGTVVLIEDVTEAKILERSKDEFFTIASHELRTPLTIIRGNSTLIRALHKSEMQNPELANKVGLIEASCLHLIDIVNDFLNLSRLEQKRMEFKNIPTAIEPVVDKVIEEFTNVAKQQNLTLQKKISGALPMALIDGVRLKQVLTNLIGNSLKFTEEGSITIAVSYEQADRLTIRVTDTGNGIPLESQHLLFHKFQQAGHSILSRAKSGGTGLGLYISKLMTEGMHGEIVLESSVVGQGTTFRITLPIAR